MRRLLLVLPCILLPLSANAAELRGGEILVITENQTDDLYIVGGQIDVNAGVRGDMIGAGGEITSNGAISQDVALAGGRVHVGGTVGDDARIAGGEVRISGTVTDDIIITGGRIEILESAEIGGDVRIVGGEVFIDGQIDGDIDIRAGRVVLRGTVGGSAEVSAGDLTVLATIQGNSKLVAEKMELGTSARFESDVTYWTESAEIDFTPALDGAGAVLDPALEPAHTQVAKNAGKATIFAIASGVLTSLFFSIAFIVLATVAAKTTFTDAAKRLQSRPWSSALTGLLYFCCTPIVLLLLTITIVGLPLAILGGVLYGFSLYFALPLSAIILAKLVELRFHKHWHLWQHLLVSIVMFIVLCVLAMAPLVGWLGIVLISWFCCGALLQVKWKKLKELR